MRGIRCQCGCPAVLSPGPSEELHWLGSGTQPMPQYLGKQHNMKRAASLPGTEGTGELCNVIRSPVLISEHNDYANELRYTQTHARLHTLTQVHMHLHLHAVHTHTRNHTRKYEHTHKTRTTLLLNNFLLISIAHHFAESKGKEKETQPTLQCLSIYFK